MAPPGGCCAAYKIEQINEDTGEAVYIARFGVGGDKDEASFNFTCGKVNDDGYTCKPENIKDGDLDETGNVCHCYQNKCNTEIPALSSSTSSLPSSTTSSGTSITKSSFIMNSVIVFALFSYLN